jgi:hypothetical protein
VRSFVRAPLHRKLLAFEALAELARARLLTLLPARRYLQEFGVMNEGPADAGDEAEVARATEIGDVVSAVGRVAPFRALCLQQAIAVRRMLRRRGVPAAVFLGVSRDRADRAAPDLGRAAHAWVKVGTQVVNGVGDLDRYVVVARFG